VTDEERPTDPPPDETAFSEVEIGSLPPSVTRDIARRLMAYEDRQVEIAKGVTQILRSQMQAASAEAERHARLDGALERIEASQSILGEDVRNVRLEQARHSQELVRLQAAVVELKRDDHSLGARLDELSRRLDAQEARENGWRAEARQRITHDAATAREVVEQDAGAARDQLATEASEARAQLERERDAGDD
jgi:hypothetical protein